ncbi:biotin-dependent carboxyltransferase family protein [Pelagovum pacificum]|uniref:Biotin-dependent carboxyltransferase family protein n=1 Tax=Pelagovum pacificum TaxID=2588711 RepID=A0A5C5G9K1_9RHOB|nr:biotin-dependent carboxyltransferase family protein [Pelagovum pacificum]QQA41902.1 biotin-dependent carboxyltransferase family protein [Pelagovum pacificum]TNY30658.1 biotin-dependent carboxyltransferase family protein [Pelagovum pacificum]
MIEILKSGPANAIHDLGRPGLLHLGISRAGAMDRLAFALGNALLGNPPGAAAIEVAMFPFRVRFEADTCIALTGADAEASLDGRRLPPAWVLPVKAGQELTLGGTDIGARAYISIAGGIDVPEVLGSRSTDLKSGFGGLDGRGLAKGDRLPIGASDLALPASGHGPLLPDDVAAFWQSGATTAEVRMIPAAEHDDFTEDSRSAFFETDWLITNEANRMGYRLEGPDLTTTEDIELFSHGLLPGTVQVPRSGQPIVQLADANTCGGYCKIGVVIAEDLWKFAQFRPGGTLRFRTCSVDEALEARTARMAWLDGIRAQSSATTAAA